MTYRIQTDNPWDTENIPARHSADAFVFFGATGDLAYKKIFPALHNMLRHGSMKCRERFLNRILPGRANRCKLHL